MPFCIGLFINYYHNITFNSSVSICQYSDISITPPTIIISYMEGVCQEGSKGKGEERKEGQGVP